jgi:GTP-sensing pleiotropic transcriptional regulator CodY
MTPNTLPQRIFRMISSADHPLGTAEICDRLGTSWDRTITALRDLRGDGKIEGRKLKARREGTWVWWRKGAFGKVRE